MEACRMMPHNKASPVDGGIPCLFHVGRVRPAATDPQR